MKTEETKQTNLLLKLETKDYLLLVPTLATGLAVIYELGSFYPLGTVAFSLFSITDHLLWALQMLPYSIITVGISITAAIFYNVFFGNSKPIVSSKRSWRRRFFAILLNICIGMFFLAFGLYDRSGTLIVIGIFGLTLWLLPASRQLFPAVLLRRCAAFVFTLGFDGTRRFLNKATPAQFEFSSGNIKNLILVRSGDHALLLFDRDLQQFFKIVKLDELKSIVWQRASLSKLKITHALASRRMGGAQQYPFSARRMGRALAKPVIPERLLMGFAALYPSYALIRCTPQSAELPLRSSPSLLHSRHPGMGSDEPGRSGVELCPHRRAFRSRRSSFPRNEEGHQARDRRGDRGKYSGHRTTGPYFRSARRRPPRSGRGTASARGLQGARRDDHSRCLVPAELAQHKPQLAERPEVEAERLKMARLKQLRLEKEAAEASTAAWKASTQQKRREPGRRKASAAIRRHHWAGLRNRRRKHCRTGSRSKRATAAAIDGRRLRRQLVGWVEHLRNPSFHNCY